MPNWHSATIYFMAWCHYGFDMPKEPLAKDQDKFVLRLPEGMRDRIKKSADANKRSMNAEIIQALEQMFPPEPDVIDVLDRVHRAIRQATNADRVPYRAELIDALDKLSERLSAGLEFDQYQPKTLPQSAERLDDHMSRMDRWRRVEASGVETSDLKRELDRGMFDRIGRDRISSALEQFRRGRVDHAFKILRISDIKFSNQATAVEAIVEHLRRFYEENWGDPDVPYEPWKDVD